MRVCVCVGGGGGVTCNPHHKLVRFHIRQTVSVSSVLTCDYEYDSLPQGFECCQLISLMCVCMCVFMCIGVCVFLIY